MYRVSKFGHELSQLQLGQANRAGGRWGRGEGLQVGGGPIAERREKERERGRKERERGQKGNRPIKAGPIHMLVQKFL